MAALAACCAAAAAALALLVPAGSEGQDAARRAAALTETSRALATAVDTELEHRAQILATLAASPVLDRPDADLRALYGHALAAAGVLEAPVMLADLSLAQLVNTTLPFGTILPPLEDAAPALRALESGGTAVMRSTGAGDGPARLVVAVPVKRVQRRIAVLITEMQPEVIGAVLDSALPAGMTAAVVEPDGTLVATATQIAFPPEAAAPPGGTAAKDGQAFARAARPLRLAPDWRLVVVRPPAGH